MSSDSEKIFRTSDYKLAAFLLIRNIHLEVRPNPRRPTKAEFSGPATDALIRAVAEFASDAKVPVQSFCESLTEIKDQIMDIARGKR